MYKYYCDYNNHEIIKIDIVNKFVIDDKEFIEVRHISHLNKEGKVIFKHSTKRRKIIECFQKSSFPNITTLNKAIKELKEYEEKEKNEWRSKVTDIKHLLELPFQTIMMEDGGNDVDISAIEVYKEKCKELLGIDINTDQYSWEDDDK